MVLTEEILNPWRLKFFLGGGKRYGNFSGLFGIFSVSLFIIIIIINLPKW